MFRSMWYGSLKVKSFTFYSNFIINNPCFLTCEEVVELTSLFLC